jgi:hypothetical protein
MTAYAAGGHSHDRDGDSLGGSYWMPGALD